MHTISQQSKVRKLKLQTGIDDTIYTTFNDYGGGPVSGLGHHAPSGGGGGGLYYPGYPPPPPQYSAGYPVPPFFGGGGRHGGGAGGKFRPRPSHHAPAGHALRFNGLNYLSYPGHTASYQDWSREHSPGHYHLSNLNQYRRLASSSSASRPSGKNISNTMFRIT